MRKISTLVTQKCHNPQRRQGLEALITGGVNANSGVSDHKNNVLISCLSERELCAPCHVFGWVVFNRTMSTLPEKQRVTAIRKLFSWPKWHVLCQIPRVRQQLGCWCLYRLLYQLLRRESLSLCNPPPHSKRVLCHECLFLEDSVQFSSLSS